jgi:hypothetical protein
MAWMRSWYQTGLPTARSTHPNDVLLVLDKSHGVVKGHDLFLAELGLALEGKGVHHPRLRDFGVLEPLLTGLIAFQAVFLLDDAGQKPGVGKVGLRGSFEVFLPAGQKAGQPKVFELPGQGFIHHSGKGQGCRSESLLGKRGVFQFWIDHRLGSGVIQFQSAMRWRVSRLVIW